MAFDSKQITFKVKKVVVLFSVSLYRSVRDHPFIWAMACVFVWMYRFFPSLFFFFVSSSPVLVCTAVLLGALLSFGQPQIPEVEEEEAKKNLQISSLKSGVSPDNLFVQREKEREFVSESSDEKRREIVETIEAEVTDDEVGELKCNKGVDFPLTHEEETSFRSIEIEGDERENVVQMHRAVNSVEREGELGSIHLDERLHDRKVDEFSYEKGGYADGLERDEIDDSLSKPSQDTGHLLGGDSLCKPNHETPHFDAKPIEIERVCESSDKAIGETQEEPDSLWKHFKGEDYSSDSDSDCAESSSPDASMADIMPMLDELHPLLDSAPPQPTHGDDSDEESESEQSSQSSDSEEDMAESDRDADIHGEHEEEEEDGDHEPEIAVKWTEDDEKNLMDLGTSELERNRRLENLIAKRRAKKNQRVEDEKNLIDLDSDEKISLSEDQSVTINEQVQSQTPPPPPSPLKRNPFDLPFDEEERERERNEMVAMSPLPSVRQNPFDLPYESVEETRKGSSSRQGFMDFEHRDLYLEGSHGLRMEESYMGEIEPEKHESNVDSLYEPDPQSPISYVVEHVHESAKEQIAHSPVSYVVEHVHKAEPEVLTYKAIPQQDSDEDEAEEEGEVSELHNPRYDRNLSSSFNETESASSDVFHGDNREMRGAVEFKQEQSHLKIDHGHESDSSSSGVTEDSMHETNFGRVEDEEMDRERESESSHYGDFGGTPDNSRSGMYPDYIGEGTSDNTRTRMSPLSSDEMVAKDGDSSSVFGEIEEMSSGLIGGESQRGQDRRVEEPVYDSSPSALEKTISDMARIEECDELLDGKLLSKSSSSVSSDAEIPELGSSMEIENKESMSQEGMSYETEHSPSFSADVEEHSPGGNYSSESGSFQAVSQLKRSISTIEEAESEEECQSSDEKPWRSSSPESSAAEEIQSISKAVSETYGDNDNQGGVSRFSENNQERYEVMEPYSSEPMTLKSPSTSESEDSEEDHSPKGVLKESHKIDSSSVLVAGLTGLQAIEPEHMSSKVDNGQSDIEHELLLLHGKAQEIEPESSGLSVTGFRVLEPMESSLVISEVQYETLLRTISSPRKEEIPEKIHSDFEDGLENDTLALKSSEKNPVQESPHPSSVVDRDHDSIIKEIGEDLLSELDVVGDFRVEVDSNGAKPLLEAEEPAKNLSQNEEDFKEGKDLEAKMATVSEGELEVLEASSVEDINSVLRPLMENETFKSFAQTGLGSNDLEVVERNVGSLETQGGSVDFGESSKSSDLVVLEASTLEDIDSVLKPLSQKDTEKLSDKSIVSEPKSDSELVVVEARSLADIDSILKKETEKLSDKSSDSELNPTSEMEVFEAKSREDIDSVLKQFSEKESDSEHVAEHGSSELEVEAKSLEDIDSVLKQFSEKESEKLDDKSTDSESPSRVAEHGSGELKIIESELESMVAEHGSSVVERNPEPVVLELRSTEEIDTNVREVEAQEPEKMEKETPSGSSSSAIKKKKAGSDKSDSDSSSSSSSTSSDWD
ncbi:uncharacterized protein LOC18427088 [Amborella trichopoda]|uniref:Uncharacterized protein n=1 Tax=Amborella trichopoda TaxID=13333 RepID=W1NQ78_AMBTC|nr:uncharacterized protein LOC18427088 [Amborella trichopoda]ERM99061.1 hypothetical protein AMTR_s00101p00086830 [Amborella trichopoda]|eukprot:XP_006836208.1 uncharacterized protein LOC18427088 [Amborella trichopoda]